MMDKHGDVISLPCGSEKFCCSQVSWQTLNFGPTFMICAAALELLLLLNPISLLWDKS